MSPMRNQMNKKGRNGLNTVSVMYIVQMRLAITLNYKALPLNVVNGKKSVQEM